MERVLLVFLGSGVGGALRYLVGLGAASAFGSAFPYGTLIVNVAGSFLIGFIMHVGLSSTLISPSTRIFLTTGIMGGLTTYSTFNYETLEYARSRAWVLFAANVGITLVACLVAGTLGLAAGRALLAR